MNAKILTGMWYRITSRSERTQIVLEITQILEVFNRDLQRGF